MPGKAGSRHFIRNGLAVAVLLLIAVTCGSVQPEFGPGFTFRTAETVWPAHIQIYSPGIYVTGNHVEDRSNAQGATRWFQAYTNWEGLLTVSQGRQPSRWQFNEANGRCAGANTYGEVMTHQFTLLCEVEGALFEITPGSMNGASPSTTTLSGTGVDTTYGTPRLAIVSALGYVYFDDVVDSATSESVTVNGSRIPALSDDTYYAIVQVRLETGDYNPVGGAEFYTYGNPQPQCFLIPPEQCVEE